MKSQYEFMYAHHCDITEYHTAILEKREHSLIKKNKYMKHQFEVIYPHHADITSVMQQF